MTTTDSRFKRCVFLLMDGTRPDVLEELAARGDLPNIRSLFFEKGEARRAASVFPSTTGPAYLPFVTGCFPGTCNIPGIRWLDREAFGRGRFNTRAVRSYVGIESYLMNRDLSPGIGTMFELLRPSATIFSVINRGVPFRGNHTKLLRSILLFYAKFTHNWSVVDRVASSLMVKALRSDPKFLFVALLGVDEQSHLSHPRSEKTLAAYRDLDATVGKLVKTLGEKGLLESTLIVASSDHGLTKTEHHVELWDLLEQEGRKVLYYPNIFRLNPDAACMVSGNAMAHLYFRKGGDWRASVTHGDLEKSGTLARLLSRPEIDHVITRAEGGGAVVSGRRGRAIVREQGGNVTYVVQGGDPFGYGKLPETMSFRECLEKTFDTEYPDAPVLVAQLFRSPRAGDAVVTAAAGYDLRIRHEIPEHFSSHGSLLREHVMVPLLCNRRFGSSRPARTVDVFPTILDLMGEPLPPYPIDGVSLA